MATGTLELPTFEWIVPQLRYRCSSNLYFKLFSPECHLPDSSWQLKALGYDLVSMYLLRTDSGPSKVFTCKVRANVTSGVATHTGFFKRKDNPVLQIYVDEMLSRSDLVITCYIKSHTPQQESEDANSVIGREIPKDEDWSPLDIKDDTLLRERMKEMLTNGRDHDITIFVQDKEFRAHRNILSSRSPVFAMMLTHDSKENNTGIIKIEDCDPESFDEFLLYVYSGRTGNLTPSNALQLYYPADKYDFPVLKERCVRILKTSLSVESICDVVLLAEKHQEKDLLEVATEFFARNRKKILVTVQWQKFLSQNLVEANELLIKSEDIRNPEN